MNTLELSLPTKIFWGEDILESTLHKQKELLKGNILIITSGKSINSYRFLEKLTKILKQFKEVKEIYSDKVSANPKLDEIDRCIRNIKDKAVNLVIGFGGGSAMDAAKVMAAAIGMNVLVSDLFFGFLIPNNKCLPVIAIPTTAGTGSELSKGAIITDEKNEIKAGIRGEYLYPILAIVDARFTYTVPYKITMETGFDVFAHAVESYISANANLFSELLSRYVIKNSSEALRILSKDIHNEEARKTMSYTSLLMGINLGNVGTALPHRMQYPVGAKTDTSHAAGLLAIYPAWVKWGYPYSKEKFQEIGSLLSGQPCGDCKSVLQAFDGFIDNLNVKISLSEMGIKSGDIEILSEKITGCLENDPAFKEDKIIEKIYKDSL